MAQFTFTLQRNDGRGDRKSDGGVYLTNGKQPKVRYDGTALGGLLTTNIYIPAAMVDLDNAVETFTADIPVPVLGAAQQAA